MQLFVFTGECAWHVAGYCFGFCKRGEEDEEMEPSAGARTGIYTHRRQQGHMEVITTFDGFMQSRL